MADRFDVVCGMCIVSRWVAEEAVQDCGLLQHFGALRIVYKTTFVFPEC